MKPNEALHADEAVAVTCMFPDLDHWFTPEGIAALEEADRRTAQVNEAACELRQAQGDGA